MFFRESKIKFVSVAKVKKTNQKVGDNDKLSICEEFIRFFQLYQSQRSADEQLHYKIKTHPQL